VQQSKIQAAGLPDKDFIHHPKESGQSSGSPRQDEGEGCVRIRGPQRRERRGGEHRIADAFELEQQKTGQNRLENLYRLNQANAVPKEMAK
jgi:hypothetical protein